MLYLFWALLNIGLIILFIIVCLKAAKLIKEKLGGAAAVIFVLGLLSYIGRPDSDKDNSTENSKQTSIWKFASADTLDKGSNSHISIDLEKTLMLKYSLGISYGKDEKRQNIIPVNANTFTEGLVSGTSLEANYISVNNAGNNQQFGYEVNGTIKWSLLGITIYSQPKNWKGTVVLK